MKDIVLFSIYTYYTLLSFCLLIKYLQNSYTKRLRRSETRRSPFCLNDHIQHLFVRYHKAILLFCLFLAECEFLVCKFEFTAIDQHHVCAAVDDLSAEVGVIG